MVVHRSAFFLVVLPLRFQLGGRPLTVHTASFKHPGLYAMQSIAPAHETEQGADLQRHMLPSSCLRSTDCAVPHSYAL